MCNFLSVLIVRNGGVLHHPMLDSHVDLVTYFRLRDASECRHFAKAELTPTDDWLDPSTWAWTIDEEVRPAWLDDVEASAERKAREIARRMILRTGEHQLIVDGCWIVGGDAIVSDVRAGRIVRVQGSATVCDVGGFATVRGVWDFATVRGVGDSATVQNVRGSATVQNVGGFATVRDVGDSATVQNVRGSATVCDVWGFATVQNVGGFATVRGVGDSATVRGVGGSATVRDVGDSVRLDDSACAAVKRSEVQS